MIYRNGKLIIKIQQNILDTIESIQQKTQKSIGAVYKGSRLVWRTIYDVISSCFGSGTWIQDKPWIKDDTWKNN